MLPGDAARRLALPDEICESVLRGRDRVTLCTLPWLLRREAADPDECGGLRTLCAATAGAGERALDDDGLSCRAAAYLDGDDDEEDDADEDDDAKEELGAVADVPRFTGLIGRPK
jgi:hypothetical protein